MEKDDALLIFTPAYALDWLVGDPEWAPHPARSFSGPGDDYVRLAVRSSEGNLRLVALVETWLRRSE